MADIKLYQIKNGQATSKSVVDFKYEREIQKLCEQNIETFFGIRFLASGYTTGNKHNKVNPTKWLKKVLEVIAVYPCNKLQDLFPGTLEV